MPKTRNIALTESSDQLQLNPGASAGAKVTWINNTNVDCTVTFAQSPFPDSSYFVPARGKKSATVNESVAPGTYAYTCSAGTVSTDGAIVIVVGISGHAEISITATAGQLQLTPGAAAGDTVNWVNLDSDPYTMQDFNPANPQLFPQTSYNVPANGSKSATVNNNVTVGTAYAYQCSPSATGGTIIIVDPPGATEPESEKGTQRSYSKPLQEKEIVGVGGSRR